MALVLDSSGAYFFSDLFYAYFVIGMDLALELNGSHELGTTLCRLLRYLQVPLDKLCKSSFFVISGLQSNFVALQYLYGAGKMTDYYFMF